MEVHDTQLHGVRLIIPEVFCDHRGEYIELYDTKSYADVCADLRFVQDDISVSHEGVLRGLHGDWKTTKLVTVLGGEGYALLADNREDSPTYRQWQSFTLTRANRHQLLIPPGIGNSVVSLDGELIYHYKQTTHYVPGEQFTIRWDDETWGFDWPIDAPILSDRDAEGSYVH